MNFKYRRFPTPSFNNPLQKKAIIRPIIKIDFRSRSSEFGYFVLIDSGADYCLFHARVGEEIGIDIKSGRETEFSGTSGALQKAYFHRVTFFVGGVSQTSEVGFSYDLDKLDFGLLGQYGFFDHWSVKFEYNKENIELRRL